MEESKVVWYVVALVVFIALFIIVYAKQRRNIKARRLRKERRDMQNLIDINNITADIYAKRHRDARNK